MTIILQSQSSSDDSGTGENSKNRGPSFMSNDLVVLAREISVFTQTSKGTLYNNNDQNNSDGSSCNNKKKIMGCLGACEYGRKGIEKLPVKVSRKYWLQLSTGEKSEKLVLIKLGCNVTNMREFSALCRVKSLNLLPYLLCKRMNKAKDSLDELSESLIVGGDLSMCSSVSSKTNKGALLNSMGGTKQLGEGFIKYAKNKFNSSQIAAISAAATEYGEGGFTLVKGPPGTSLFFPNVIL